MTAEAPPLLQTIGLTRRFGGIMAVRDFDFTMREGETRCIIGPNGAGKTTLFNLITGLIPPTQGSIRFRGRDITHLSSHAIARLGISRSFQTANIFTESTVLENVRLAAQLTRERMNPFVSAKALMPAEEEAREVLAAVNLLDRAGDVAAWLSHGEKKRLEFGMILACRPQLLLLDEPTAGMNSRETAEFASLIKSHAGQMSVLIIEHDITFVWGIAEVVTVMHQGSVLLEGPPREIEQSEDLRAVYLGT